MDWRRNSPRLGGLPVAPNWLEQAIRQTEASAQCVRACSLYGLHEESGVPLGSIIPWARNSQDCRASIIAGAAHHRIGPANLTSVPVQRPKESEGTVVSLNFKSDRRAHDEAARGKRSRLDRPRTEAGPTESNGSGDTKATLPRASAALSNVPCHVECSSLGSREGAIQD